MQRREFLVRGGGRTALIPALVRSAMAAQRNQTPTPSNDNAGWEGLIADLKKQFPMLMEEARVPGLSIAIIRGAKLEWRQGFGVKGRESNEPVDQDTMFEAASMSKPVFAYAAMKLCEKGVLGLDTPLTKYTSERFLDGDPRLDAITARHVLSHTSGFQDWRSARDPLKIHFTPGEKWQYSGEGYSYLQSVVTRLTGHVNRNDCSRFEANLEVCATDIDQYMTKNVFVPFGMTSSGYVWNGMFEKRMARPHDRSGNPLEKKKPTAAGAARYAAAGGLLTTPTDYAKFLVEVIDPKSSGRFRLTRNSLREMMRPQVKVEERDEYTISWGLGWRIAHTREGDLIGHGGDNLGFHCLAEASPQRKSGYVIMTNGDNGWELIKNLAPELSRRLHRL